MSPDAVSITEKGVPTTSAWQPRRTLAYEVAQRRGNAFGCASESGEGPDYAVGHCRHRILRDSAHPGEGSADDVGRHNAQKRELPGSLAYAVAQRRGNAFGCAPECCEGPGHAVGYCRQRILRDSARPHEDSADDVGRHNALQRELSGALAQRDCYRDDF